MKNVILFFLFLNTSSTLIGQISMETMFQKGFKVGFKEGYCYGNEEVVCFYPMPPLAPLPNLNESKDSYMDGYNRGFQIGLDMKRANSNQNSKTSPKFSPYISTRPSLLPYLDLFAALGASGFPGNSSGKGFSYREQSKSEVLKQYRDKKRLERKNEIAQKRYSRRLTVGTTKYIKIKKRQPVWIGTSVVAFSVGSFSYVIANNTKKKYINATDDAVALRMKGNTYYTLAPICILGGGLSLLQFTINSKKISNAKIPYAYISPAVSNSEVGFTLSFKL